MLVDGQCTVCSKVEQDHLLELVRLGQLFELMQWVDEGKATLVVVTRNIRRSLICEAVRYGFHSMVVYLWENNPLSPPRMMLSTSSLKKQIPSTKSATFTQWPKSLKEIATDMAKQIK
jgi:hypothetical protein